jgi:hypothetical protein
MKEVRMGTEGYDMAEEWELGSEPDEVLDIGEGFGPGLAPPWGGLELLVLRRKAGLKQKDAAALLGVRAETLSRIERQRQYTRRELLDKARRLWGPRPRETARA